MIALRDSLFFLSLSPSSFLLPLRGPAAVLPKASPGPAGVLVGTAQEMLIWGWGLVGSLGTGTGGFWGGRMRATAICDTAAFV